MVRDVMVEVAANFHGGTGRSLCDGTRNSPLAQPGHPVPAAVGVATEKYNFIGIEPDDVDLLWLREHATRPE